MVACGSADKDQEKKIAEEVTAMHDIVMPKMDEIMAAQRDIKAAVEKDSTLKTTADSLNTQLSAADDAMMEWMQKYNPNYYNEGHTHAEVLSYYEAERKKIEEVQKQMESGIAATKQFLKK
jgi:hypothetical protein